jgi:hypothetical protein
MSWGTIFSSSLPAVAALAGVFLTGWHERLRAAQQRDHDAKERQRSDLMAWRRTRLERLAEAIDQVGARAQQLFYCVAPAPSWSQQAKDDAWTEYNTVREALHDAELSAEVAAGFVRDAPLLRALDAGQGALMKMRKALPPTADFRNGTTKRSNDGAGEALQHLQSAIQAAHHRIELLASGVEPSPDPADEEEMHALLTDDEAVYGKGERAIPDKASKSA